MFAHAASADEFEGSQYVLQPDWHWRSAADDYDVLAQFTLRTAPLRFHQEIDMQNLVVWHAERGYLVDFDPFGKQETTWSIDISKAWVFGSLRDAKAAMRWLSGPLQILPRRTDHK